MFFVGILTFELVQVPFLSTFSVISIALGSNIELYFGATGDVFINNPLFPVKGCLLWRN